MMQTNFWLIRHAIVAENERATLYGVLDVNLCPDSLVAQVPMYRALAARLLWHHWRFLTGRPAMDELPGRGDITPDPVEGAAA